MMKRTMLLCTVVVAALFSTPAGTQPFSPIPEKNRAIYTKPQIPPGRWPGSGTMQRPACQSSDPAITSLTLTKGSLPNQLKATIVATNLGVGAYHQTPTSTWPDNVHLSFYEIGHPIYDKSWNLPTDAAPGAQMLNVTTDWFIAEFHQPLTSNPMNPVSAVVGVHPTNHTSSIHAWCMGDSKADATSQNDSVSISPADFTAFISGPEQSHTYTP